MCESSVVEMTETGWIQIGILTVLIFQSIIFAIQLLIIFWQFWLRLPRVKCKVQDSYRRITNEGVWRFADMLFTSGDDHIRLTAFDLHLTNISASPVYIIEIVIGGHSFSSWICETVDTKHDLLRDDYTFKWHSMSNYCPFPLMPYEHRNLTIAVKADIVDINTKTEVLIRPSRGRTKKLYLQYIINIR